MWHAVRFDFAIVVIADGEVVQDLCHCARDICVNHKQRSATKTDHIIQKPISSENHLNYTTINKKKNRNAINLRFGNKLIAGRCLSSFCPHLSAFGNCGNGNVRPDLNT